MTFARRFLAEARRQSSARTETGPVRRLRLAVANLSIAGGVITALYRGDGWFQGWMIPVWVAGVLGGLLGIGVYLAPNRYLSRRLGVAALALTVLSVGGLIVVRKFG